MKNDSLNLNKELDFEKEVQKQEKSTPQKKDDFSKQDLLVLLVGIGIIAVIIFGLAIAGTMSSGAKTIEELHQENYETEETEESIVYNGFSFIKLPDPRTRTQFWYTQYQDGDEIFDIPMHYNPREVEHIEVLIEKETQLRDYETMYISINPSNDSLQHLGIAVSEISEKLTKVKRYPIKAACMQNTTEACHTRPIVNCENVNNSVVITFNQETERPFITINDNCITVYGQNETLVQASNKLIYRFLGIMP